jgi:hypothetical protein
MVEMSSPLIAVFDPLAVFDETKPGEALGFEGVLPAMLVGTWGP